MLLNLDYQWNKAGCSDASMYITFQHIKGHFIYRFLWKKNITKELLVFWTYISQQSWYWSTVTTLTLWINPANSQRKPHNLSLWLYIIPYLSHLDKCADGSELFNETGLLYILIIVIRTAASAHCINHCMNHVPCLDLIFIWFEYLTFHIILLKRKIHVDIFSICPGLKC